MEEITVDVEKIMQEIKEDIATRKKLVIPPFEEVPMEQDTRVVESSPIECQTDISSNMVQLTNDVQYLQNHYNNPYYWDFGGGIKGFIKRIVRRLIKCVVYYLVEYQNTYNSIVAEAADATRLVCLEQQQEIAALKAEIDDMRSNLLNQTSDAVTLVKIEQQDELLKMKTEISDLRGNLLNQTSDVVAFAKMEQQDELLKVKAEIKRLQEELISKTDDVDRISREHTGEISELKMESIKQTEKRNMEISSLKDNIDTLQKQGEELQRQLTKLYVDTMK